MKQRLIGLIQGVAITDLHLYGGLAFGWVGGEAIWPGVGYAVVGTALFWLAIRKVK